MSKFCKKSNGKPINTENYTSLFLVKKELKTRQCVYISQQVHSVMSKIVQIIADSGVSTGGYIDNILLQHLEIYKDEINALYKQKRNDLIEFIKTEIK